MKIKEYYTILKFINYYGSKDYYDNNIQAFVSCNTDNLKKELFASYLKEYHSDSFKKAFVKLDNIDLSTMQDVLDIPMKDGRIPIIYYMSKDIEDEIINKVIGE